MDKEMVKITQGKNRQSNKKEWYRPHPTGIQISTYIFQLIQLLQDYRTLIQYEIQL